MTSPALPPAPFIHVQRSGVSVMLPASPDWAGWDETARAARDITPPARPSERRGR